MIKESGVAATRRDHTIHIDYQLFSESQNGEFYLNPEKIFEDSRSKPAEIARQKYSIDEANKNVTVAEFCGDSRNGKVFFGPNISTKEVRSIGISVPRNRIASVVNAESVGRMAIIGHHDGETVKEGCCPGGCGALHEKGKMSSGEIKQIPEQVSGLYDQVERYVLYPDVLAQTFNKADHMSTFTAKPIMSATVDHRSGEIFPIAFFNHGFFVDGLLSNYEEMRSRVAKTGKIINYENGEIPRMSLEQIPAEFRDLIIENKKQVAFLREFVPGFSESQRVQNPHTLFISSAAIPPEVCMPGIFDANQANQFFKLFIPRNSNLIEKRYVPELITPVLEQGHYPLLHAIQHHGFSTAAFSRLKNIWVNTSNINASRNVAQFFLEQPVVKDFLRVKGSSAQVLASEVKDGKIQSIDVIK